MHEFELVSIAIVEFQISFADKNFGLACFKKPDFL